MIAILVQVLILLVIFGVAFWLLQQLPLPEPWAGGVKIVAVLICLVLLYALVFGGVSLPGLGRLR